MAMAAALDQTAIPPAKSARKTVPECTWPDMYFYPVRQGRGRVCEVLNAASRALENRFPRRASDFFSDLDRGSVTLESARLGQVRRFDDERLTMNVRRRRKRLPWLRHVLRSAYTRTRSRHARVCLRASFPRPGTVAATCAAGEARARSPGVALDASRVDALGVGVDVRYRRRATGWLRVQRRRDDLPVPLRRLGGPERARPAHAGHPGRRCVRGRARRRHARVRHAPLRGQARAHRGAPRLPRERRARPRGRRAGDRAAFGAARGRARAVFAGQPVRLRFLAQTRAGARRGRRALRRGVQRRAAAPGKCARVVVRVSRRPHRRAAVVVPHPGVLRLAHAPVQGRVVRGRGLDQPRAAASRLRERRPGRVLPARRCVARLARG